MLLGLDISTSITGATVLDASGNTIYADAWDTRNKNRFLTIYDKAKFIKDMLWEMDDVYGINAVFIEQPFMFFNSGGSSAKTMSTLQRFNGMISWMCCDIYKTNPTLISCSAARRKIGIKLNRKKDTKQQILDFFLDKNPHIQVEYTHRGNPKPKYKDMADSWVIAAAGYKTCIRKNI